ncbi:hypothetical protein SAMN06298216_1649 [Spirosomataceae bacterium TFI 002]|nr:hypothetical protein SAMN06298216_1649 [Spirosomataceae bacterium TFI 002]
MKKSLFIIAISCHLALTTFAQTIRRVNNTPGLNDPNVYATAQEAHDAAAPNDIISLEPSASPSYGSLTVLKRINIVGSGYFLDENPNNFFDKRQATIDFVTFDNGSANSTIMGVESNGSFSIHDANITVTRCRTSGIYFAKSGNFVGGVESIGNNAIIANNFLTSSISGSQYNGTCGGNPCTLYAGTNCTISNNILFGSISNLSAAIINYNTIRSNFNGVVGSTVTNNIFDARSQSISYEVLPASNSGTTASNNICLGVNGLPSGGGNVNGANPNIVFIGTSNPFPNWNTIGDAGFKLAVGSPALTAAAGGTQAGAYGNGANAYRLSGVPNTPIVTSFISTGSGNNTTPLSITVSVRSNN